MEYAFWVILGLWATLFVNGPIAKGAGLLLIILAVLRGLTDKGAQPKGLRVERASATSAAAEGGGTAEPGCLGDGGKPAGGEDPVGPAGRDQPHRPKQRRRVL